MIGWHLRRPILVIEDPSAESSGTDSSLSVRLAEAGVRSIDYRSLNSYGENENRPELSAIVVASDQSKLVRQALDHVRFCSDLAIWVQVGSELTWPPWVNKAVHVTAPAHADQIINRISLRSRMRALKRENERRQRVWCAMNGADSVPSADAGREVALRVCGRAQNVTRIQDEAPQYCKVAGFLNFEAALEALAEGAPTILVLEDGQAIGETLAAIRGIRAQRRYSHVPLIWCANSLETSVRLEGLAAGANEVFVESDPNQISLSTVIAQFGEELLERQQLEADAEVLKVRIFESPHRVGSIEFLNAYISDYRSQDAHLRDPIAVGLLDSYVISGHNEGLQGMKADLRRKEVMSFVHSLTRDTDFMVWRDDRYILVILPCTPLDGAQIGVRRLRANMARSAFCGTERPPSQRIASSAYTVLETSDTVQSLARRLIARLKVTQTND